MPEADLQTQAEEYLVHLGWLVFHDRAVNLAHLNAPGFPDICAVHAGARRLLFVEVKVEDRNRGRLTAAQAEWADAIEAVEQASDRRVLYLLLRPSGWDRFAALVDRISR